MQFQSLTRPFMVSLVMAAGVFAFAPISARAISSEDAGYVERTIAGFSSLSGFDEAFQRTNSILEEDQGATRARFLLGMILEKQGYESLAMEQYRQCIKEKPGHFAYNYRLLLVAIKTKDSDTMLSQLARCKQLAGGDGHVLLKLGLTMENAGYSKLADPIYEEAARAKEKAYGVGSSLARLRLKQGRFDEAIKCVNWDLIKEPYDNKANVLKGRILLKLNNSKAATQSFIRAFKADPCEDQVAELVARELVKVGKYEEALLPAFCNFWCNASSREKLEDSKRFARVFIKKVPLKSIQEAVQAAAASAPTPGHRQFFYLAVGGFFDDIGNRKLATSAYEHALAIRTNPPNDQLLARGYYRLGLEKELWLRQPEEALTLYKKSIAIYPDDKEVSLALDRLESRMNNRVKDFAGRLKDALKRPR